MEQNIKITNVRLKIINNVGESNTLLGTASIQINDAIVIHDIKLIELKEGKRVLSFPNKKVKKYKASEDGGQFDTVNEFTDLVHPSNKETREYIEQVLFELYDKENSEKQQ